MIVDKGEAVTPVGMCSFKTLLLDVSEIGKDKNSTPSLFDIWGKTITM